MTHQHGGTDAPECRSCRSQRPPTEPQLEATFEVLAWLEGRVPKVNQVDVIFVRGLVKMEVDKCLAE